MLLCEETTVMLDMLQPKADTIEKACEGKRDRATHQWIMFRTIHNIAILFFP